MGKITKSIPHLSKEEIPAAEIKEALEKRLSHKVHKTMVSRLLKRQGWRRLVPRPFHVDADREKHEAFKKTP